MLTVHGESCWGLVVKYDASCGLWFEGSASFSYLVSVIENR